MTGCSLDDCFAQVFLDHRFFTAKYTNAINIIAPSIDRDFSKKWEGKSLAKVVGAANTDGLGDAIGVTGLATWCEDSAFGSSTSLSDSRRRSLSSRSSIH